MTPKLIDCVVTTMSFPEKGEKNKFFLMRNGLFSESGVNFSVVL